MARALFFLLMIAVLPFVGCGDDSDRQASQPPGEFEQELSQFSLVRTQRGHVRWKLNADVATFLESDQLKIEGVELLIFGDDGEESLVIHGDRGEVNQRTNDIKIMGNVEGISADGGRLTAEEIYWRDSTGKIYTLPGIKVTITHEDSVIFGEELEADPELEIAELKNITGIDRVEGKEK